jgi:hypothetical protein
LGRIPGCGETQLSNAFDQKGEPYHRIVIIGRAGLKAQFEMDAV